MRCDRERGDRNEGPEKNGSGHGRIVVELSKVVWDGYNAAREMSHRAESRFLVMESRCPAIGVWSLVGGDISPVNLDNAHSDWLITYTI